MKDESPRLCQVVQAVSYIFISPGCLMFQGKKELEKLPELPDGDLGAHQQSRFWWRDHQVARDRSPQHHTAGGHVPLFGSRPFRVRGIGRLSHTICMSMQEKCQ